MVIGVRAELHYLFLQPYFENINKKIIKSPKLYFYDTELLCALLGINSSKSFELHHLKGSIFESFVISELLKYKFNTGNSNELYYWKDLNGNEIDCIISNGSELKAVEIKASETVKSEFFKTLYLWNKLNNKRNNNLNLVYGGNDTRKESR
jgi:predicted AAA+ superfamily ATPase